ncbi:hypothetical protein NQ318_001169 [Aromia moschata]|uniref:Conserved oligomeric Golgi complex subunit 1 n=1 Tax=Aromia moschata TaxID=1265417 RepID=A0AAV8ZFR7_9CUCU|nr:hypothetical protein NQ318_001169 [Aromia moschata]
MFRNRGELLELDIDKLFEERSVDEIIEIEKILDAEIEKKRSELRDRYKDVLAASDAIISMKTISQEIVDNINRITNICEELISSSDSVDSKPNSELDREKIEERTVVVQIRLAIFMNEQIWIALDEDNNLDAVQYYLLAQHIHTGLSLIKKAYLERIPLLHQIKYTMETSQNLNALVLLESQSCKSLPSIFMEHRKTALNTVINTPYPSVRLQVSSMVRCLITTVHLLHDCFICTEDGENGLIWQQLHDIISDSAPMTLSKLDLPTTPLVLYIPDIIKQYRPKPISSDNMEISLKDTRHVLETWLQSTKDIVKNGLEKSLRLVPNVRGLHLIREESFKIEIPRSWEQICADLHLPEQFNIWYYFFQNLITDRCRSLISSKISMNIQEIHGYITDTLNNVIKSDKSEADLRWYSWTEENDDVSRVDGTHSGLSMKTKGYSQSIVDLCEKMDRKYLDLLEDVSQYLYGREYSSDINFSVILKDFKFKRKYIDKDELEKHLKIECTNNSTDTGTVSNFNKCCTFNKLSEDWLKVCDIFNKTSHTLWQNWVDYSVQQTQAEVEKFFDVTLSSMINILCRWDEIEIQEQTEEKVFKSQIKVPLKPSLVLDSCLIKLNTNLSFILPHTLPKSIHHQFIEQNVKVILEMYKRLLEKELNQIQALQFLFDVKFLTTLCIPRENMQLMGSSQDICDKLRSRVDPFDLDVFYSYLQSNVKKAVFQSQMILGCLIPSFGQLASLGVTEKTKQQEKVPSVLALSSPSTSSWFPLLPVTAPSQKTTGMSGLKKNTKEPSQKPTKSNKKIS